MKPQIDQFDLATGWTLAPDPLPAEIDDSGEEITKAGFQIFSRFGVEESSCIDIFSHRLNGTFLVSVCGGFDQSHNILVANFPSLIELLPKLSGFAAATHLQAIYDRVNTLHDLLTSKEGPLHAAQS